MYLVDEAQKGMAFKIRLTLVVGQLAKIFIFTLSAPKKYMGEAAYLLKRGLPSVPLYDRPRLQREEREPGVTIERQKEDSCHAI